MSYLQRGDHLEYLRDDECAPILLHRQADALLAVLEAALNAGIEPGIGLNVKDARDAGFAIVAERFRGEEPYRRGVRIVATVGRLGIGHSVLDAAPSVSGPVPADEPGEAPERLGILGRERSLANRLTKLLHDAVRRAHDYGPIRETRYGAYFEVSLLDGKEATNRVARVTVEMQPVEGPK